MAENALAPDRDNALAQPSQWDGIVNWLYRNAPEYLKESARSLYEGPRNRAQGLWDEFKDSRLSGQTAAGIGSTLDPVRMLPGANSGMLFDIPRTMYLSRFGTQELPAGTDVYKYSNGEDAAGQRFARENPETAQTIGASMEAQFSHPLGMGFVPHAVSRGIDRAGNTLAEHTPGPDQVNMFIGPKAKTWDAARAARAAEMEAAGVHPDRIWEETRTGNNFADGKWRQEIPDNDAALSGVQKVKGEKVWDFSGLNHPLLEASYGKPKVVVNGLYGSDNLFGTGGQYLPENTWKGPDASKAVLAVTAHDADQARSVTLHELTHAVPQEIEGFARGANPADAVNHPEFDQLFQDHSAKIWQEIGWRRLLGVSGKAIREEAARRASDEFYYRSAGENEANNVMNRDKLLRQWLSENPGRDPNEWIAKTPPWKTQDVPNEQQIVRFGNDGVQESRSYTPPTPWVGYRPVHEAAANSLAEAQAARNAQKPFDYSPHFQQMEGANAAARADPASIAAETEARRAHMQRMRDWLNGPDTHTARVEAMDAARRAEIQKWLKDQGIK